MKHEFQVTILLVSIFFFSQIAGLYFVSESLNDVVCDDEGCVSEYETTSIGERPQTTGSGSLIYLLFGVAFGTCLLLLLAKFKKTSVWKVWFFLAVWTSSSIALGVVLPFWLGWLLGLIISAWKLYKPNIFVYNLSEVLMYSGIGVLLIPIFDLYWALILLLIISVYDMIAVWKSKHMVKMATFISDSNAFAGLVVPYKKNKISVKMPQNAALTGKKKNAYKNAILGGGDITFPLIFAGVFFQDRVMGLVADEVALSSAVMSSFFVSLIISVGATAAIAGLFIFAKKDRFYPAMPFVTAGCLLGWAITFLF